MIVYSIIMFIVAALFLFIGIAVRKGNTKLIHDYHKTNIKDTDLTKYGKDFAKGLFTICVTLLISGMISLFGESRILVFGSIAILFVGIILSIIILFKVQKKYNGGIF